MAISRDDIVKREYQDRKLMGFSVKRDTGDFTFEVQYLRDPEDDRVWHMRVVVPLPWSMSVLDLPFMAYSSNMKIEDVAKVGMQLLVQQFVQAANDMNAMSYVLTKALQ